jgi:membrane-bound lytic murein transglycosylase A
MPTLRRWLPVFLASVCSVFCLTVHSQSLFTTATTGTIPASDWDVISESELPQLTPDGSLKDFRLAMERQLEACREYENGKVTRCGDPTPPPEAKCNRPTLEKLALFAKQTSSWTEFYDKSKSEFMWYRSKGKEGSGEGLFTGYNNPSFEGTLVPTAKYKFPVYAMPNDLVKTTDVDGQTIWRRRMPDGSLGLYFSRKEIDVDKVLEGKGLEIAYLDDLVSVLRLHIEGTGNLRVKQNNGSFRELTLNFAAKNGIVGSSVFTYLKQKGVDKKYLSFDGLRQYFKDFPDEIWPTLTVSKSYVFFRLTDEPPCGTAAVHLTPGHSIALDPKSLPLGAVVLFDTQRPILRAPGKGPAAPPQYVRFTRFAVAQDTGGAILGPARVDVYWGADEYAEFAASNMKTNGKLYLPVLKTP